MYECFTINAHKTSFLPFKSIAIAHIVDNKQSTTSGHGFEAMVVDLQRASTGGIQLFNLNTKKLITRGTFKFLDAHPKESYSRALLISRSQPEMTTTNFTLALTSSHSTHNYQLSSRKWSDTGSIFTPRVLTESGTSLSRARTYSFVILEPKSEALHYTVMH